MNEKGELIQFNGRSVEVRRRPYQRSLSLKVKLSGRLRVTCGLHVKAGVIEHFLLHHHAFIEKSLREVGDLRTRFPKIEFVSGDLLMLGGREVPLQVVWSWNKRPLVEFLDDSVELKIHVGASREQRQKAVARAYKNLAKQILPARLAYWAELMKLNPQGISVRGQRTRWGSCSPDGKINLNWKLVGAPADVIDYVLIHELAHLEQANHSPRFWQIVERYCSDYRIRRKWLRTHQYKLEFLESKSELHAQD